MNPVPNENQPIKKKIDSDSILIKLCTAAALGAFVFSWNTNAKIAVLDNNSQIHTQAEERNQNQINDVQNYLRDVNGRLSKVEDAQKVEKNSNQ